MQFRETTFYSIKYHFLILNFEVKADRDERKFSQDPPGIQMHNHCSIFLRHLKIPKSCLILTWGEVNSI